MDFWHGGDMVDRVTQAPGIDWNMVRDALVQNKTSLYCCYRHGLFLDQTLSSVPSDLGHDVPAPHLVSHRDTDPESVGRAACRPEGDGKVCVLTGPRTGVVLPGSSRGPPQCPQATQRYSFHLSISTTLGACQTPALQVSGSLATRCDNSRYLTNPWTHILGSQLG